jgi:hypothetical protein
MRRSAILLTLVLLAQLAPQTWANPLPGKIGYTIYARGERIGHCDITVTRTDNEVIFDTITNVNFNNDEKLEMKTHTTADPKTFLIRSFYFDGTRAGTELSGEVFAEGDSIYGTFFENGKERTDYRKNPFSRHLFLEDFVMSHEVLIARAHVATGADMKSSVEYGLVFPSSFTISKATLGFASTLEIESDTEAVVCKKLLIGIEGSQPFASYYDPERGLPVYMVFPQSLVEVFLDDFFGDSPVTRYRE